MKVKCHPTGWYEYQNACKTSFVIEFDASNLQDGDYMGKIQPFESLLLTCLTAIFLVVVGMK